MRTQHRLAVFLGAASVAVSLGMLPTAAVGGGQAPAAGGGAGATDVTAPAGLGGTIAFSRKCTDDVSPYELYVLDGGTGVAQSLHVPGQQPTWSPDGRQIAFYTWQAGNGIFVTDADGSYVRLVRDLTGQTVGADPAWSPNGKRIAFTSDQGLMVMAADGSHASLLAADGSHPAWSPDGRWIAFTAASPDDTGLYVMRANGRHVKRLTDKPARAETEPAWSPNGRSIAFSGSFQRKAGDITRELFVVKVESGHVKRLTHDPADVFLDDSEPAWSPNGRRIAWVRGGAALCSLQLYVMKATGSHARPLTNQIGDQSPAWFGPAPTRTTADARPEPTRKGTQLTVTGTVTKVGVPLAGAEVRISFRAHGSSQFTTVTTTTTGGHGGYGVKVTAWRSGTWRAVHPATTATQASSDTDHVTVHR